MENAQTFEAHCKKRGLVAPRGLTSLLKTPLARSLDRLLYRPDVTDGETTSLGWALNILGDAVMPPPTNLLPLLPVDDASMACAICASLDSPDFGNAGRVIRWHLSDIPAEYQGAILDQDAEEYVRSVAAELSSRPEALAKVKKIGRRYQEKYVAAGIQPRASVERPIQLACQNVIIGLTAFAHDASFDGLRVPVYLSCEVPHLATHEADRALAALILCDAYQNGGTMEIRFGSQKTRKAIPPGFKRFGRSLGIALGREDETTITPTEARQLFLAVTPMPVELRARALDFMDRGLIAPEHLCYILLEPVWCAIELDYLLATSSRAVSILEGGKPPVYRRARLAELEVSRAAIMVGMLLHRLDNNDTATQSEDAVRVFEDNRRGVEWTINGEIGAVVFADVQTGPVAWSARASDSLTINEEGLLIVVPRALPTPADHELIYQLQAEHPGAVATLLVPADMASIVPYQVPLLLCPDRLSELDHGIEGRLLRSRVSRS